MQAFYNLPIINGHSYEWSDVQLSIAGALPVIGITSIAWNYKREHKNILGQGSEPTSFGYGSKSYEAEITIMMEELEPILAVAPYFDITQIPRFSITASWLDTENIIVTHTLSNCRFMDYDLKTKAGEQSTPMTLKIIYAGFDL